MADDDLTAALAKMGERHKRMRTRYGNVAGLLALAGAKDDMPRALAALNAVLKLADDWDAEARGIFLEAARTADAGEVGAASALQSAAADLREAITTALAKGEPDHA